MAAVDGLAFGLAAVVGVPILWSAMSLVQCLRGAPWPDAADWIMLLVGVVAAALALVATPTILAGWLIFWWARGSGLFDPHRTGIGGVIAGAVGSLLAQLLTAVVGAAAGTVVPDLSSGPTTFTFNFVEWLSLLTPFAALTLPIGAGIGWWIWKNRRAI